MFHKVVSRSSKAVFVSCVLACTTISTSAFADGKTTYGALAVDVSQDRGEPLREKQAKRIQDWQDRIAERREAIRERMEERRKKRTASLRAVSTDNKEKQTTRRSFSGRGEDDGWTWDVIKSRKKAADPKPAKTIAAPKVTPTVTPKGKYGALIAKYAKQHGVPYSLARAVVQVESTFRPNVTGGAGEIGLMQIKLATARGMGYKGSRKQLYNPATNLYWGMKYLGKAHRLAGGSTCGTILKYNAGHGAKRMNKISANYCRKVQRILA